MDWAKRNGPQVRGHNQRQTHFTARLNDFSTRLAHLIARLIHFTVRLMGSTALQKALATRLALSTARRNHPTARLGRLTVWLERPTTPLERSTVRLGRSTAPVKASAVCVRHPFAPFSCRSASLRLERRPNRVSCFTQRIMRTRTRHVRKPGIIRKRKVTAAEIQIDGIASAARPACGEIGDDPDSRRAENSIRPHNLRPSTGCTVAASFFSEDFVS